jgi:hypothetical protein
MVVHGEAKGEDPAGFRIYPFRCIGKNIGTIGYDSPFVLCSIFSWNRR